MTFPIVESTQISKNGSVTTHTVTMPTGVVTGDLLIAILAINGSPTVGGNIPANWTQRSAISYSTALGRTYYRISDGTEGASQTYTTNSAQVSAHIVLRISGHDASTAPEISTFANGTSTAPNPNAVTPSWGAADTLWIPLLMTDGGADTTGWPESANNLNADISNQGTAACTLSSNAASYNAGAFTISNSAPWVAYTIAVRPGAAPKSLLIPRRPLTGLIGR